MKVINTPRMPTDSDQPTPRTALAKRTRKVFQNANTNLVKEYHSLTIRQLQLSDSSQSLGRHLGQKYQRLGASTSQRQVPECTTQMNEQQPQRYKSAPYFCRGEIDPFTRLNALQQILDVPLQLRMGFLQPLQIQHYSWISLSKK